MTAAYVHWNGGAVMVKEAQFFVSQGGLTKSWGARWVKIEATSIDEARRIGQAMHARGEL